MTDETTGFHQRFRDDYIRLARRIGVPMPDDDLIEKDYEIAAEWGEELWVSAYDRLWASWDEPRFPLLGDFRKGIDYELGRRAMKEGIRMGLERRGA